MSCNRFMNSMYLSELEILKAKMVKKRNRTNYFAFFFLAFTILNFVLFEKLLDIFHFPREAAAVFLMFLILITFGSFVLSASLKKEIISKIESVQSIYNKCLRDYAVSDNERLLIENRKHENTSAAPCAFLAYGSKVYFEKDFLITVVKKEPRSSAFILNMIARDFYHFTFIETVLRVDFIKTIRIVKDKENGEILFLALMNNQGETVDDYILENDSNDEYEQLLNLMNSIYSDKFEYVEELD